jgi:hypothetical protein
MTSIDRGVNVILSVRFNAVSVGYNEGGTQAADDLNLKSMCVVETREK